jgi:DNA polymerase III subunit alpha
MTLEKAYEQEEILRDFIKVDEEAAEIWDMARKLEGVCVTSVNTPVVW